MSGGIVISRMFMSDPRLPAPRVERAHQVGVGALGVVPCLFAQRPDAAGKKPANAQGQQQGQQDQTGSGR